MKGSAHLTKTKFNISWISILVIFLGSVVYVPMLHWSEKEREVIYYRVPITIAPSPAQGSPTISTPVAITPREPIITKDLRLGDVDPEVKKLQEYLNQNGFVVADSGPGSPGQETSRFGAGTHDAVIRFQEAHADVLLAPYGLEKGTGIVGELTRNLINS